MCQFLPPTCSLLKPSMIFSDYLISLILNFPTCKMEIVGGGKYLLHGLAVSLNDTGVECLEQRISSWHQCLQGGLWYAV